MFTNEKISNLITYSNNKNMNFTSYQKQEKPSSVNNSDYKLNDIFPNNIRTTNNFSTNFSQPPTKTNISEIFYPPSPSKYPPIISSKNYSNDENLNLSFNIPIKKPSLNLFESRTKLKELREKLINDPEMPDDLRLYYQEQYLLAVPFDKFNDEKYKLLRMKNLKMKQKPEYKSSQKPEDYKSYYNCLDQKKNYSLLKRKKMVYSEKNKLILHMTFYKNENSEIFPLYRDDDIGIFEYWQCPLQETKVDEDMDTDDEQKKLAAKVCKRDIMEGVDFLKKNGDKCINNLKYTNISEESKKKIIDNIDKFLKINNNNN